jgi:hypothetical protein
MYGLDQKLVDLYYEKVLNYDKFSTMVKAFKLYREMPVVTGLIIYP